MGSSNKYSPEVRERAVRMVLEHQRDHDSQWAAIESIAEKMGCTSETLRKWVRQGERDQRRRFVRQRTGGVDYRAVQDGGDSPARAVAGPGGGGVRNP